MPSYKVPLFTTLKIKNNLIVEAESEEEAIDVAIESTRESYDEPETLVVNADDMWIEEVEVNDDIGVEIVDF